MSLLVIDRIAVVYAPAIIGLTEVSLTVQSGTMRALLGANGAGKTTTLKAVSNLLPAERGRLTAGRILYDGADVTRLRPSDLVRAGLVQVLEGRRCFRSLSVEENLVTGALGRGATRAETAQDLERVYGWFPRLQTKRRVAAGLTSGGEQQMVAIGRALMARPRLLLLDEPSMGLAPLIVQEIFGVLRRLVTAERLTILIAEQNATQALAHADAATVLETGRSVLDGPAADLAGRADIRAFYLGEALSPDPAPTPDLARTS